MNELFLMCIIDNIKIDWHIIDYNIITTTKLLDRYIKTYLYNNDTIIEYDRMDIKKFKLEDIVKNEPKRLCLKIYN